MDKIKDDPVFFNNSNNPQILVEEQVAITLFQFRHNGNAASQESVARWEGEGSGGKGSPALHGLRHTLVEHGTTDGSL